MPLRIRTQPKDLLLRALRAEQRPQKQPNHDENFFSVSLLFGEYSRNLADSVQHHLPVHGGGLDTPHALPTQQQAEPDAWAGEVGQTLRIRLLFQANPGFFDPYHLLLFLGFEKIRVSEHHCSLRYRHGDDELPNRRGSALRDHVRAQFHPSRHGGADQSEAVWGPVQAYQVQKGAKNDHK